MLGWLLHFDRALVPSHLAAKPGFRAVIEVVMVASCTDECTVSIVGELDADNARSVEVKVEAGYQPPASLLICVDQLEFIDSSGMSSLLRLRQRAIDSGGSFAVKAPSVSIQRVFEIAGLLDAFGLAR